MSEYEIPEGYTFNFGSMCFVCDRCSCLISDPTKHNEWHELLYLATQQGQVRMERLKHYRDQQEK